mmetsp:Transcript_35421/g.82152  ORF Transcript_35421/g.82152 Transcript_35421/m.82152 type:complete len:208 (+) Transcript_35421:366-989(+)
MILASYVSIWSSTLNSTRDLRRSTSSFHCVSAASALRTTSWACRSLLAWTLASNRRRAMGISSMRMERVMWSRRLPASLSLRSASSFFLATLEACTRASSSASMSASSELSISSVFFPMAVRYFLFSKASISSLILISFSLARRLCSAASRSASATLLLSSASFRTRASSLSFSCAIRSSSSFLRSMTFFLSRAAACSALRLALMAA